MVQEITVGANGVTVQPIGDLGKVIDEGAKALRVPGAVVESIKAAMPAPIADLSAEVQGTGFEGVAPFATVEPEALASVPEVTIPDFSTMAQAPAMPVMGLAPEVVEPVFEPALSAFEQGQAMPVFDLDKDQDAFGRVELPTVQEDIVLPELPVITGSMEPDFSLPSDPYNLSTQLPPPPPILEGAVLPVSSGTELPTVEEPAVDIVAMIDEAQAAFTEKLQDGIQGMFDVMRNIAAENNRRFDEVTASQAESLKLLKEVTNISQQKSAQIIPMPVGEPMSVLEETGGMARVNSLGN